MATTVLNKIEDLIKALELGGYNAAPGSLVQGSALQVEDVSPVMHNVTFSDQHIKLQKELKSSKTKGQLVQFNRQLSYGAFGGSAQAEGQVGQEETSDFVRAVVPMCYYSHIRRVTVAANMAETQDGVKAEDREAMAGAKKIAADIEFDLFRGKADFSNAGVFDGNPLAIPTLPNMLGLDPQIRQSDSQTNTQDLMFEAYGSNLSNIVIGSGTMTQSNIEDCWVRGVMNHGTAEKMYVDPLVLSAFNKASYASKERFNLGGTAQEPVTGVDIRRQAVSGGVVTIEPSRFLSGQTRPKRARGSAAPAAPSIAVADAGSGTAFLVGEVYTYFVTAENEVSESLKSADNVFTVTGSGKIISVTITPGAGTSRYFNVYRSLAGGTSASARLIGRVKNSGAATTVFTDLGNRKPGGIAGYLVQPDTMEIKELAPYSRLKLGVVDLSQPEAHFRFCCLAVYEPRKNVILENLTGSL
jgi:hypothetical protein